MRFLLATNDAAGSHDGEVLDEVAQTLGRHGTVDRLALSADTTDDLVGTDADRLVVAGGDGTVHHAVKAFVERSLDPPELAVVPLGTGNDLARSLGLDPADPGGAAVLAATGRARPTDVVRGDLGVLVNAAHAGLGAAAAERSVDLKERLGALAYPLGAVIAAVREDGWELTVTVDGERVGAGRALLVGIGNGRTIGGGTPMFPQARLDDGALDVIVVDALGLTDRVPFGLALRTGDHLDRPEVVVARGERVEMAGDPVVHDVDGELTDPTTTAAYEVERGGLEVVRVER